LVLEWAACQSQPWWNGFETISKDSNKAGMIC
jgi:hypothetical protein